MSKSAFSTLRGATAAAMFAASLAAPAPANAASEPFVGELMLVGFNFCPRSWASAEGQILSIAQNTALFALLGTTYGGNGTTTFALPDLRGRVPLGQGTGPGLSNVIMGQVGGTENATLLTQNMPAHSHAVNASNEFADKRGLDNAYLARIPASTEERPVYRDGPPNRVMAAGMIGVTGGSQPFSIRNPYLGLRWCIALQGIFPPRD